MRSRCSSTNSARRFRVPGAFASLLAQERDTPSCRATAAILTPASIAPAMMYRFAIRLSVRPCGRPTRRAEEALKRLLSAEPASQCIRVAGLRPLTAEGLLVQFSPDLGTGLKL